MFKHLKGTLSAMLSAVLLVGFLVVALSHYTPQHDTKSVVTDTIVKAGFGGDNTSSKSDARMAEFAQPDVGEWFKPGAHHSGPVFSGWWTWHKPDGTIVKKLLCVNFSKHSGDGIHWDIVHGMKGWSKANARAAFKIANADQAVLSKVTGLSKLSKIGSVAGWTAWHFSPDKNVKLDWKPAYVPQLKKRGEYAAVQKLTAWAKNVGPYHLVWDVQHVGVNGKPGHDTVTVKAANGHPASYVRLSLSGNNNVKLSTQGGLTNGKGQLHFTHTPTDFGSVVISAKGSAPSSTTAILTDASPGRQRLLTGHFPERFKGSTQYSNKVGKATVKLTCTNDCDAVASVLGTGTNQVGTKHARYWFTFNNVVKGHCDAHGSTPCTKQMKVADASIYTGYWTCTLGSDNKCASPKVFVKRNKEIICPGKPALKFSGGCDCFGNGTLVLSPASPASSTRVWKTWETDNGSRVGSVVTLTNGQFTDLSQLNIKQGHDYEIFVKTKAGGHIYTYSKDALQLFSPWHLDRTAA